MKNILISVIIIINHFVQNATITIKIWNGEAPYTLIKQINLSKPQCCNSIIQITNTNYMITGMFTQQIYVWDLRLIKL